MNCPSSGCIIGNVTNLDLGITSFTSDNSPGHDLTWTVGLADIPHHNSINDTWLKSYYLGTLPTLDFRHIWLLSLRRWICAIYCNISAPKSSNLAPGAIERCVLFGRWLRAWVVVAQLCPYGSILVSRILETLCSSCSTVVISTGLAEALWMSRWMCRKSVIGFLPLN